MRTLAILLICIACVCGCKDDDDATAPAPQPEPEGDFFPIDTTSIWTYRTNALGNGIVYSSIEISIDHHDFPRGRFLALLARNQGTTQWGPICALKDSGGIVYSLGDQPPETPVPLFKHRYATNEIQKQILTFEGRQYEANKLTMLVAGRQTTIWLGKGIGIMKEESSNGMSLWSDDNAGRDILITSVLTNFQE